uniref:ATP-dependent Clp protease proteolytic subunit n=1 Tax=Peltoboykinia tellimoides TaxID=29767 RepID=A0A8K1JB67_9MAGN|nr:Clp protease proteolytic subunit [Peltoboykinia tellimoides]
MPVGVPKVAFRIPGDEEATWVDLYNRLYRGRFLFLGEEVSAEISNQIMGLMVFLSIEDNTQNQYLFLNTPGGKLIPGIGIYDTIQLVIASVHTVCIGLAASMGSFILLGGEITERIAYPHARVMIHQPRSTFFEAPTGEFVMEAEEVMRMRDAIAGTYAQLTGKPLWVIIEDMERDTFMSATEAQVHGIIDLVGIE